MSNPAVPLNPLIALFDGEPAMIAHEWRSQFEASLVRIASDPRFDELMGVTAAADDGFWPAPDDWRAAYRPYVVENGTLAIPVRGVLLNNFPWQLGNWATGYEYVWRAFERGLADSEVVRIALVINSGGGLVAGNQDLVDRMTERAGEKPVRAFAADYACSAAYNIATAGEQIVMTRTALVGSIGVRATHVDWSKWNEQAGLTYTILFEGEGKTDGDPDLPLSDGARTRLQARLAELYEVFVSSVAANRDLDPDHIRNELGAYTYSASQAQSNGLADALGRLDDALADFAAEPLTNEGDETMSTQDTQAANQAAIDQARAEGRAEAEQGQQAAVSAAVKAERERVAAITGCEEAKGRETLANHIAMNTEMPVDDAKAMLAAAPAAAAAPEPETPFNAAAGANNPELGADGGAAEQEGSVADQILSTMFGPRNPEQLSVQQR